MRTNMKSIGKQLILCIALSTLAAYAGAQSKNEQLTQMVEQLAKKPEPGLREKIIKLANGMKPAPGIPEEARRSFIMGESLFKQAKSLKQAYEAADAFSKATSIAPWWGNAYWNLAVAQQFAGQYGNAKQTLNTYLLTNLSPADRRAAQDRIYALDAEAMAAESNVARGIAGFWQRTGYQSGSGEWKKDDLGSTRADTYEIQQTGSGHSIKCMRCDSDDQSKWTVYVVSSSAESIVFQKRLVSPWYDSGIERHECTLNANQLHCTITDSKNERYFQRYAKRNVCEVVGGPGITGYFVGCK